MSRDPLHDAVRALRDEGDAAAPQAKLTRERILRDLRPRARSRRWVWAVPVAALLAGSTVLAATGQLPVVLQSVGETAARVFGGGKHAPRPAQTATPPVVTAASAPAVQPAPAPEPPAEMPQAPETPPGPVDEPPKVARPEPSARRRARSADAGVRVAAPAETTESAPPPASAPPPEASPPPGAGPRPPEPDETLALYRKAHRLHFVEQNPSAALAAWDEYLAKKPKGPLVVDALYDRAVCLVRLGRRAEAKAALEPFADGRYGSYRQKDARALLDALTSQ